MENFANLPWIALRTKNIVLNARGLQSLRFTNRFVGIVQKTTNQRLGRIGEPKNKVIALSISPI